MHRVALVQLPQVAALDIKEKEQLSSAYKYGYWLGLGLQFPFVLGAAFVFGKYVPKFSAEWKMLSYTFGIGGYGMVYMFTKAWAWHQAHYKVEHIIKKFILTADIEDIKKIQEEKALGITKNNNVYLPKE